MELQTTFNNELIKTNAFNFDFFKRWSDYLDASKKTIETYNYNLKQFIIYLQNNGITEPTRETILNYRSYLLANHKPATANGYLTTIKLFFSWLASEGLYKNIADRVKNVKLENGFKKDYLTAKQATRLIKSIDTSDLKGLRNYALLVLMLTTGLRSIEISRAKIEDLRPQGDFIALYIQGKGRQDKGEYVKVSENVELALREYLKARGTTDSKAPLFASASNHNNDGALTTRSLSRIVKEALINAGFNSDRLTGHSLRHTTATLNLLAGGTLEETKQLLRHKNINTTLIYAHALERANNNSEQRVANAIFTSEE